MTRSPRRAHGLCRLRRLAETGTSARSGLQHLRRLDAYQLQASGPHDFAVRFGTARQHVLKTAHGVYPALLIPFRARCRRVHRTPVPTFGDDGQRPFLRGQDGVIHNGDLRFWKSEILPDGLLMSHHVGSAQRRCRTGNSDAMPLLYSTANCLFCKSVTSINPGACVIANGSLAAAITACGVTPQAQNTGISSAATGTGSP